MATYYIGSMPVGDSLMHYRTKGSRNGVSTTSGYRAIGQLAVGRRLPDGTYVYDSAYPGRPNLGQARSSAMSNVMSKYRNRNMQPRHTRTDATSSALRSQYMQERQLSSRTRGNTSQAAKNLYRSAYGKGLQSYAGQAALKGTAVKSAVAGAYGTTVSQMKHQLTTARSWARGAVDWASTKVSQGLSAARSFISNILKKIGAGVQAVSRWARITMANTAATVRNQADYEGRKIRRTVGNIGTNIGNTAAAAYYSTSNALKKKKKGSA